MRAFCILTYIHLQAQILTGINSYIFIYILPRKLVRYEVVVGLATVYYFDQRNLDSDHTPGSPIPIKRIGTNRPDLCTT